MRSALGAVVVVLLSGCAEPPDDAEVTVLAGKQEPCGFQCGGNGGLVGGIPFAGMWLTGAENPEDHVQLLHYARTFADMIATPPVYAAIDIIGDTLGWGPGSNPDVQGGVFEIAISGKKFYVLIAEVHRDVHGSGDGQWYWAGVPTPKATTYKLMWSHVDDMPTVFTEVCPVIDPIDHDVWENAVNAIVFEGEKYDPTTRAITLTPTAPHAAWINVACEGSLPAKLDLSRRTTTGGGGVYHTTIADDRQALVHAWAAEYCGAGKSFTHTGHQLRIRDKRGWFPHAGPVGWPDGGPPTYEAVWDNAGAVCINTPRMQVNDGIVPPNPHIEDDIKTFCGKRPPTCDKSWFPDHWTDHGLFLTATP